MCSTMCKLKIAATQNNEQQVGGIHTHREEVWLLGDEPDVLPQPLELHLPDINTVHHDGPCRGQG
jgi:hypothetical protein